MCTEFAQWSNNLLVIISPFCLCKCIGLRDYPVGQMKKAASSAKRTKAPNCDPPKQTDTSGADQLDPDEEENKPKAGDNRPDREVRVELQGSELWKRFYEIGTEMIITKAGRCR